MSLFRSVLFLLVVTASAISQSFECQPVGALPMDPSASCEGVACNNLGVGSGVSANPVCGFPSSGSHYAVLFAAGPVAVPAGGPVGRPVATAATEMRIPIPAGSTTIFLSWDFFNAEGGPQTTYNDGVSIDVVGSGGSVVANLLYLDTHSPLAGSTGCNSGEVAPAGAKSLQAILPPLGACDYVSVVVWNGGDNAYPSSLYLDNVQFNSALAGCPVPCFIGVGPPTLSCSSIVQGSLLVNMGSLPPGGSYVLAVTLNAGAYPNGWLYGLDITLQELNNELNIGFPFVGPVSASGCSAGTASIGPIWGAPSGLTFYAVALGTQGPGLAGSVSGASNTVSYTIP